MNSMKKIKDYNFILEQLNLVMGYCNLTHKEFKMAIKNKFNKLPRNSRKQFNKIRNKNNEQKKVLYQRY